MDNSPANDRITEHSYDYLSLKTQSKVIELSETQYNQANKVIKTTSYLRFHNATGNGVLNGSNGSRRKTRRTYHCAWHDAVGRAVEQADYGSKWFHANLRARKVGHRPDHQQPLPTDGESDASIDAKGIEIRLGKSTTGRTVLIENYDTSEPSQDYGANRVTVYDYNADGQLEVLTLVSSVTGEQITRWNYGATLSESGLASNSLLRAKIYPESNDEPERLAGTEIDYAQAEPAGRRRRGAASSQHNPLGDASGEVYERIEYQYNS